MKKKKNRELTSIQLKQITLMKDYQDLTLIKHIKGTSMIDLEVWKIS